MKIYLKCCTGETLEIDIENMDVKDLKRFIEENYKIYDYRQTLLFNDKELTNGPLEIENYSTIILVIGQEISCSKFY